MADVRISVTKEAPGRPLAKSRLLFIDNVRWSMIILVLSMHAADTYSPFGNWYYVDRRETGFGTALFFGIYQSFLQAFFMAALFFIVSVVFVWRSFYGMRIGGGSQQEVPRASHEVVR